MRPAHQLIAEEILHQGLGITVGDKRNWRVGLADLTTKFIDLLAELPRKKHGAMCGILRAVIINRDTSGSQSGLWDAGFSPLLEAIPNVDGRRRVLEHLTRKISDEPHFWAHLGRFCSKELQDHAKAHLAYRTALGMLSDDPVLHHMAGIGWRAELYSVLDIVNNNVGESFEMKVMELVNEASREFEESRSLGRRSEHSYISQIEMTLRVVGTMSKIRGFQYEVAKFVALPRSNYYREMVDQAQNLLSDLMLVNGSETPSNRQQDVQANLEKLYGNHSEAIQSFTNLLDRRDVYRPPIRRAIIREYEARRKGDWNTFTSQELARVVQLAKENVDEEPASDYNLRLWFRAVRTENTLSVDRVAEQLSYKRLQNPSVDTVYYLYIMTFLQLEAGDLSAATRVSELIKECRSLAQGVARTTTSNEWLGKGSGLGSLVYFATLGTWDESERFWRNTEPLKVVRGRIARIRHQGSGEVELQSGLRAFFVPSSGKVLGGYIGGQDRGREVEFYLGFSYDGLRAWSVRDPV